MQTHTVHQIGYTRYVWLLVSLYCGIEETSNYKNNNKHNNHICMCGCVSTVKEIKTTSIDSSQVYFGSYIAVASSSEKKTRPKEKYAIINSLSKTTKEDTQQTRE